jgi:hypothetical protein
LSGRQERDQMAWIIIGNRSLVQACSFLLFPSSTLSSFLLVKTVIVFLGEKKGGGLAVLEWLMLLLL